MHLEPLSLFVRWAHVAGMAAILGGALLVWWVAIRGSRTDGAALTVARQYEWIFWAAIGIQAMTGVGNLGAFGSSLPSPTSAWGTRLTIKLIAVLALALFSIPRTLAVVTHSADRAHATRLVPALYGTTAALVVAILGLAVWLAHG